MKRCCPVAVVGATLMLAACGTQEEQAFSDTPSPDGRFVLHLAVAESRMPQGPFYVRAYVRRKGEDEGAGDKVVETKLENDGVPFTTQNLAARWIGGTTALLCLRATDRPDQGYRIEAGPPAHAVAVDKC